MAYVCIVKDCKLDARQHAERYLELLRSVGPVKADEFDLTHHNDIVASMTDDELDAMDDYDAWTERFDWRAF